MENEPTIAIYRHLFESPELLAKGIEYLDKYLRSDPNFLIDSVNTFINPNYETKERNHIGVIINALINEYWDILPSLKSQKNMIIELVLHGILYNVGNLKIIETLSYITLDLMSKDDLSIWVGPLNELIKWINTDDINIIASGLEYFTILFANKGSSLYIIVKPLMPILFEIFANPELNEENRVKLLTLLYLVITSFSSVEDYTQNLIHECFHETYELWITLFISAIQTSPKKHISIKRYIIKILTVIFRDLIAYSKRSIQVCLMPIWNYFNQILPIFVWTNCFGTSIDNLDDNLMPIKSEFPKAKRKIEIPLEYFYQNEEEDFYNDIEGLTFQMIELISTFISSPIVSEVIKIGLIPLINSLCHFMILTNHQDNSWRSEVNQFIFSDDETKIRSMRTIILKLISDLIEKFGDNTNQTLILIIESLLFDNNDESHIVKIIDLLFDQLSLSESSPINMTKEKLIEFVKSSNFNYKHPASSWKKKEVGLLVLGSISDDVIDFQSRNESSFDIEKLLLSLTTDLENAGSHYLLIGRTLWTIMRFSELIINKCPELFLPLLRISTDYLHHSYPLAVRLVACKSVTLYCHKINKLNLMSEQEFEVLGLKRLDIIGNCFEIMKSCEEDNLFVVIEAFYSLNQLSDYYLTHIAEYGAETFLQIFQIYNNDLLIGKSISDLLKQLSSHKRSFPIIFKVFEPFIMNCFKVFKESLVENPALKEEIKNADIILLTNVMEVLSRFLKTNKQNGFNEKLIILLPALINMMMVNEDTTLQTHASICLKNFIIYNSEEIVEMKIVDEILKIINKLLLVTTNESCALYLGNLIILLFNNITNNTIDPDMLKSLVSKIYKCKMPSTVQSLILVFAKMINTNTKEAVGFLTGFSVENRMGLKVLIDKWLLHQPLFRGKYLKNATIMALGKLLMERDKRVDNLIVIGFNPSHTNINSAVYAPYKILSTLIRCYDNEMKALRKKDKEHDDNSSPSKSNYDNFNERMDTLEDDDQSDEEFEIEDNNDNQIEVDLEKFKDDDDCGLQGFNMMGERKDQGLADVETGSACYMSDMLDFQYEDGDECDSTTEEDLLYLKDTSTTFEITEMLKGYFIEFVKKDNEYLNVLLKKLPKEDISLWNKYLKAKNI